MAVISDRILASDALDRLEARLGGRAAAKETLADMLRDGKLQSRASRVWVSDEKDVDVAWDSKDLEFGEWDTDVEIAQWFWRESIQWIDDTNIWRWPESFFLVTESKRPFKRTYYENVSFLTGEIDRISSGERLSASPTSNGGRRPDLQRWEAFWMEIVQIAVDGNLVPGQIASQAALREDVLAAMRGSPLSEDSIKGPIRRVWHRFCEVQASEH